MRRRLAASVLMPSRTARRSLRSRSKRGTAQGRSQLIDPVEGGVEHGAAGGCVVGREEGGLAAGPLHPGNGEVDAVEALAVGLEVLKVVEDLEGGAECVGRGVGLRLL